MSIKIQKYERNFINKKIQNNNNKDNIIIPYKTINTNSSIQNKCNNQKIIKINKSKTIEGNTYSESLNKNSNEDETYKNNEQISNNQNKIEENNNRNEENRNIFKTKYDYIVQKGKITNGPVEIPSDLEIQKNLNKKEWINEKIKLEENVKRSDIIKKIKIFNNKKNNDICSNILKKMKENEKKLIVFPYVQKKQKINKTIDTIGHSNGITYLNINLLRGGNTKYNNFISNMRFDENDNKKIKGKMKINCILNKLINRAEIDLI